MSIHYPVLTTRCLKAFPTMRPGEVSNNIYPYNKVESISLPADSEQVDIANFSYPPKTRGAVQLCIKGALRVIGKHGKSQLSNEDLSSCPMGHSES
jgi:hypothetical protein